MMIPVSRRLGMACLTLTTALWTTLGAAPARAQISFVNLFFTGAASQTGNGNTLTSNGYYFTTTLTSVNPGDFAAATLTYPGPASPVALTPSGPSTLTYFSSTYPTSAALSADYPFGTYTYNTTGGNVGAASTNVTLTANHYPTAQPFLTGTDYAGLQGVNAGGPITLHFSPYANDPAVNNQITFFTVFDTTLNTFVYDAGFLPSSTTSVTLGANTLQAGHNYIYELINSNRVQLSSPGAGFNAEEGFDLRTTGTFATAATPEPGSLALLLSGSIGGSLLLWRRRRRSMLRG